MKPQRVARLCDAGTLRHRRIAGDAHEQTYEIDRESIAELARTRVADQAAVAVRPERVAEMYARGDSMAKIATTLGRSTPSVLRDLRRLGIQTRRVGAPRKHPNPGVRTCAREGCEKTFTPTGPQAAAGWGSYCSHSCRAKDAWDRELVSPDFIRANYSGAVRQEILRRRAQEIAASRGKRYGRKSTLTEGQVAKFEAMAIENEHARSAGHRAPHSQRKMALVLSGLSQDGAVVSRGSIENLIRARKQQVA